MGNINAVQVIFHPKGKNVGSHALATPPLRLPEAIQQTPLEHRSGGVTS